MRGDVMMMMLAIANDQGIWDRCSGNLTIRDMILI